MRQERAIRSGLINYIQDQTRLERKSRATDAYDYEYARLKSSEIHTLQDEHLLARDRSFSKNLSMASEAS